MIPDDTVAVVVTDGLWRKSLSAVRSLGRAGLSVGVVAESRLAPALWSRFARQKIIAPSAAQDPAAFFEILKTTVAGPVGAGTPRPVLLPMEDATLSCVSKHREELEGFYRFIVPSREGLAIAFDKARTHDAARKLGISTPRTWVPAAAGEVPRLLAEAALSSSTVGGGSWVVKPRAGSGSNGIVYGGGREATSGVLSPEYWEERWREFGPLLVQTRVAPEGDAYGASFLFDRQGRPRAEFVHRRLRQYPVSGGPSTDRVSAHHPRILLESRRLLERLGWRGIAMVEWKIDPESGEPLLLEINPRFWGSLELAVRAGVDFPALYARACRAESPAESDALGPPPGYRDGVRCRWMWPGEVLRYLSGPRGRRERFGEFLKGSFALSEEWAGDDWRGWIAAMIGTCLLALRPRYWKYLRRG